MPRPYAATPRTTALVRAIALRAVPLIATALLAPLLTAAAHPTEPKPFAHPGVHIGRTQLDAVRERVRSGQQPWRAAYDAMRRSRYAALDRRPRPHKIVACKPYAKPRACTAEREDAIAAYTHALLWYVTEERAHADKARQIMDSWSAVIKDHTEGNAGLQTAWAGSTWARAAEIVRHTGAGWPQQDVDRFSRMLRQVYLPELSGKVADYNGNWDLAMTDATAGIAVFLDDRKNFDRALSRFRARVPAYFYLRSDGKLPVPPPGGTVKTPQQIRTYWFGQKRFVNGLGQETCRNFEHVGYALAATSHIAETAWHQGVDLYAPVRERLATAMELHSRYQLGEKMPKWLCGGKPELTMGPDLEVAVNHLGNRLGGPLQQTRKLAARMRPAGTDDLFVAWETLTHAENP